MLTIQGPGGPRAPDRKPIRSASSDSLFRLPQLDIAAATQVAAPAIEAPRPTGPPDAAAADLRAQSHGGDMLDVLAQMQRDMLSAGPNQDLLHRLANLADAIPEAASPDLRAALRAVATRAKVELARHQVAELAAPVAAA